MRTTLIKGGVIGTALGVAAGVAAYTFGYAKGWSYLTNNPAACANCHIMWEQYDAWHASSHRSVAACNDCHTPHALIPKYLVKAENGFWHSFYFTTGTYRDPVQARDISVRVVEKNCRRCHTEIIAQIDARAPHGREMSCVRCHRDVGHPNR